jgi:hypothetical protein
LFDDINEWRRGAGPPFVKLDEGGFDLRGIERFGCFFPNPTIIANHYAEHHADFS